MKSITYSMLLSLGILMFGISNIIQAGQGIPFHNNTKDFLCVGFVRTKAPSLLGKIGIGKTKENRYGVLYDGEGLSVQTRVIAPGETVHFVNYKSNSDVDRTAWIINGSKYPKECIKLGELLKQGVEDNNKKPEKAVPLEVGSKTNVVIIASGSSYKIEKWTDKLGKEVAKKKAAMTQALKSLNTTWEALEAATNEQWDKIKLKFDEAYKDLDKKASGTKKPSQSSQQSKSQSSSKKPMPQDKRKAAIETFNAIYKKYPAVQSNDLKKHLDALNKKLDCVALKQLFRKISMYLHPDRPDGNEEDYKKVVGAYEELYTAGKCEKVAAKPAAESQSKPSRPTESTAPKKTSKEQPKPNNSYDYATRKAIETFQEIYNNYPQVQNPALKKDLDSLNQKIYCDVVKRLFNKLVVAAHPDKGGKAEDLRYLKSARDRLIGNCEAGQPPASQEEPLGEEGFAMPEWPD